MNSPYISIDIETTGTDPERHQVLEIAAVYNNQGLDVMACPNFQAFVDPGEIIGEPYALNMNARIMERLAKSEVDSPAVVMGSLMDWVDDIQHRFGIDRFHLLGKNVGSFDLQFLKRVPCWDKDYFSYRHLEVGSLFSTPEGISGQSDLHAAVAADAQIEGVPHEALYDARVSLELARRFWYAAAGGLLQPCEKSEETA